jgi:DNA-binding protein HU-beta
VTKAEVIAEIADKTGIEKGDVSATVEAFFKVVKDSMADGNNIYVRGFGSFVTSRKIRRSLLTSISFLASSRRRPSSVKSKTARKSRKLLRLNPSFSSIYLFAG